jgi:3-hydroxyisobutyrate dehydrogenase
MTMAKAMNTESSLPRIGFIGLGVMGTPMATHLSGAGYPLALFDVASDAVVGLADTLPQAQVCRSPREVGAASVTLLTTWAWGRVSASDIVITMLPNGQVVSKVTLEADGLLAGMAPGTLLLDTSSSEPWLTQATAQALAARGVAMVDAPVSGAQWGAQAAELVFMAGGAPQDVQRVRPLLDVMGRAVFHLGPLGAGHAMKCLNNMITAMNLLAVSEGLVIGKRYGLDPAAMTDVLNESTGMSWVSKTHIHQRVLNRAFDDPFKLELMLKDVGIGMELARINEVPAPMSALGHQLWRAASLAAGPGVSVSELVRWVEQQTGTEIRSAARAAAPPQ